MDMYKFTPLPVGGMSEPRVIALTPFTWPKFVAMTCICLYTAVMGYTGSAAFNTMTSVAMAASEGFTVDNPGFSLQLGMAEIVAFFSFCSVVFPAIWYLRGLVAKVNELEKAHNESMASVKEALSRLETKVEFHSIEKCPVAQDYLKRTD
jgi:hypothetical protein